MRVEFTVRYDDRITSVESDDRLVYEMREVETKNWIENVIETDPAPEYLDQEWLDKNNY